MMSSFGGELVPLDVRECLPNDKLRGNTEVFMRLNALVAPTMHPLKVKVFHFFVPTRILWSNWEAFITQGAYGSTPPVHPYLNIDDSYDEGDLPDYMGIPPQATGQTLQVNALPFAAYYKIYDDFFRDQDLVATRSFPLANGNNTTAFSLLGLTPENVSWKKDYFTTARPWPQKSADVPIPQSGIVTNGSSITVSDSVVVDSPLTRSAGTGGVFMGGPAAGGTNIEFGDESGLQMDDSANIRDLRLAGALQRFFENRASDGSRLVEYLRRAFGASVQDSRLQNAELISYGEKTINFSEVLQTAEGTDPVGTLRGHGVAGLASNKFEYYVPEHGWFMTLAYIMPEPVYDSAIERHWLKSTFVDYFQSEFEAVGQQEILPREIQAKLASVSPTVPFGYQDRYDEYRRALSSISGLFRTTLSTWHMARMTNSVPTLNDSFILEAPTQRVFADTVNQPYLWLVFNKMAARRNVKKAVKRRIL